MDKEVVSKELYNELLEKYENALKEIGRLSAEEKVIIHRDVSNPLWKPFPDWWRGTWI